MHSTAHLLGAGGMNALESLLCANVLWNGENLWNPRQHHSYYVGCLRRSSEHESDLVEHAGEGG